MKRLIISILIAITLPAFSQKIDSDEVDKFTGHRFISTTKETISKGGLINPKVSVSGSIVVAKDSVLVLYSLLFSWKANDVFSISETHKVYLKCQSGKFFELSNPSSHKIFATDDIAYFNAKLKKEELQQLKDELITDIRIETSNSNYDFVLKENYQSVIPSIAKLLMLYNKP